MKGAVHGAFYTKTQALPTSGRSGPMLLKKSVPNYSRGFQGSLYLRLAALRGVGVALLPRELFDADIQTGRLQHLLVGLATTPGLVHAIFPTRRGMVPAVRHLLDTLVAGFEDLNRK